MNNELHYDVAVLGSGFTGIYAARHLRKAFGRDGAKKIALISDQNYMVFQPMLAEVCGSSISPLHAVNPNRLLCRDISVLRAEVSSIDLPNRRLTLDSGLVNENVQVTFDHLVLALGCIVDVSRVPGMAEHGFLMKTAGDALRLRAAVLDRLEEANLVRDPAAVERLLTFVIVGGGYSGVETAGQIMDLLQDSSRFYSQIDPKKFRVVLIQSGPILMPTLSESLGRYSERKLRERGINVILNARVQAVTGTKAILNDGRVFESHTVVTTVGNAPHPLILDLCKKNNLENEKGRVLTDAQLRVKGQTNLWAGGDCAAVPSIGGGSCPATAQFALRQGMLIGQNIAAAKKGKPLKPFTFKSLGELASIGHHTAVAQILGLRFSGLIAWFMWRAIYLGKLPGLNRKIRVSIDWILDLFFPREISLLRGQQTQVLHEMHLEKGDQVGHPGDPSISLYIVKTGRVDLTDDHGLIRSVTAGDYFGEWGLLNNKPWNYTATATESTSLVTLDALSFRALSGASKSISHFFQRSSRRFAQREELAQRMSTLPETLLKAKARDVMTTSVVTLKGEMTVNDAFALAREKHFTSYPLVDGEGKPQGIVAHEDLANLVRDPGVNRDASLQSLDGALCNPASTVLEETDVPAMLERFNRSGASQLLVLNEAGALQGIITLLDLVDARKRFGAEKS